jgi:hypothetical protein
LYKSKGVEIGSFDTVAQGDDVTASTFNRRVDGLTVLDDYITEQIPSTVSIGDDLYASYIQGLKTALNSIQ